LQDCTNFSQDLLLTVLFHPKMEEKLYESLVVIDNNLRRMILFVEAEHNISLIAYSMG